MTQRVGVAVWADDEKHCGIELEVYANANSVGQTLICWAANCGEGSSFYLSDDSAVRLAHALLEAVINANRG